MAFASLLGCDRDAPAPPPNDRWEAAVDAIESAHTGEAPAKDALLFTGSSSIRRWDIENAFAPRRVLNHGIDGAHLEHIVRFADRLILTHRPRTVVIYAGDNDTVADKTPERIRDDFAALVDVLQRRLPDTRVVFISIKPSIARWHSVETVITTNALIAKICAQHAHLSYVDVFTAMLGVDEKPNASLYASDGLHLSEAGYALWHALLLQHVD